MFHTIWYRLVRDMLHVLQDFPYSDTGPVPSFFWERLDLYVTHCIWQEFDNYISS